MRRRIPVHTAISAGAALLAVLIPVTAAWGGDSEVRLLPTVFGPEPPRLEPGTYQTRPAFVPPTNFTVGQDWYGGQGDHSGWCVGKGLNGRGRNFGTVAICGFRLWLPYATAVSRFKALKTVTAGSSQPIQMGGFPGVSLHAVVQGDLARTPGLPFSSTLNGRPNGVRPGGEQIFLNVRGTTLLLQIEIFSRKTGEAAVRGFLRTMQFPR